MNGTRSNFRPLRSLMVGWLASLALSHAWAQQATGDYRPQIGQAGKDVIWVPTPDALVDSMLRMAEVTSRDFVVDLGSGDGKIPTSLGSGLVITQLHHYKI